MRRLRAIGSAIVGIPRATAAAIGRIVAPLKPAPGTTEGALYVGLLLVAAGFLVRGQGDNALLIPGAVIAVIAAAPVIVGVLRKGG